MSQDSHRTSRTSPKSVMIEWWPFEAVLMIENKSVRIAKNILIMQIKMKKLWNSEYFLTVFRNVRLSSCRISIFANPIVMVSLIWSLLFIIEFVNRNWSLMVSIITPMRAIIQMYAITIQLTSMASVKINNIVVLKVRISLTGKIMQIKQLITIAILILWKLSVSKDNLCSKSLMIGRLNKVHYRCRQHFFVLE